MRLIRYISLIVIALGINGAYGQWTGTAFEFYKAQDFSNAKIAIDSAINTNERFDSQTWQLRGLIYRGITEGDELYYREIALESFVRAKKIDTSNVYTEKINDYLKNTITRYYNDAVKLLTEQKDFDKSEIAYNQYKTHYKTLLDPKYDFNESDIKFYNAAVSEALIKAENVELSKKELYRDLAIKYCTEVLNRDSLNYQANFNAGITYYSVGVDYITILNPDITIEELISNTQKAEGAFLKAIPYLKRCERINPDDTNVLIGLMGCYYGLNNEVDYLTYQTKVDIYYLASYLEQYEKDPKDIENLKILVRIYTVTLPDTAKAEKFKTELQALQTEE